MIKYEDYFPKSVLNKCNILPEGKLISDEEFSNLIKNKDEEKINQLISNIYLNFKETSNKKGNTLEEFNKFNINKRTIAMLCDLDVISSIDKEKFLYNAEMKENKIDGIISKETRIGIEIPELKTTSINEGVEKSEKVIYNNKLELEIKGTQK